MVRLIRPGRQNKLPGGKEGKWVLQEEGASGLTPLSSAPGTNVPGDQETKTRGLLNFSRTFWPDAHPFPPTEIAENLEPRSHCPDGHSRSPEPDTSFLPDLHIPRPTTHASRPGKGGVTSRKLATSQSGLQPQAPEGPMSSLGRVLVTIPAPPSSSN